MKMKKSTINKLITYGILLIAFVVLYSMQQTGNITRHLNKMLVPICYYIILAVSLNLTVGFLGELTLGHAGFMSVGAYCGCIFLKWASGVMPTWAAFTLALIVGGVAAAAAGVVVGIPVLRLHGDYLAIVTLAFGEIIRSVVINLNVTGGASGLKSIPKDSTFLIAAILVFITVFISMNLMDSKHGRAVMSIRDNAIAAEATGINLTYFKMLTFVLAAFFAGIAGVLYGANLGSLQAATFDYNFSIEILVIVVLGGLGSIRGSIIAAVIIYVLPEALRFLADYRMLIYAVVLILMMLFNSSPALAGFKSRLSLKRLFTARSSKKEAA